MFRVGELNVDLVRRIVTVRWPGGETVAAGVRDPARPGSACRQGPDASLHHARGLGRRAEAQNLRVHIRQLRQKIEDDPEQPSLIHTETGVGYRLRVPEEALAGEQE